MTDNTVYRKDPPSTVLFFGLAGSGKSYVADLISEHTGWYVYHADEDITMEMRQALAQHRPFDDEMRDRYFSIIVDKIHTLQKTHAHLLVTQAVYKQRHRDFLLSHIPDMELVYVQADDELIEHRLLARNGEVSAKSSSALRNDFEFPSAEIKKIVNDKDGQYILQQWDELFPQQN